MAKAAKPCKPPDKILIDDIVWVDPPTVSPDVCKHPTNQWTLFKNPETAYCIDCGSWINRAYWAGEHEKDL